MRWTKQVLSMKVNKQSLVNTYAGELGSCYVQVLELEGGFSNSFYGNEVRHYIVGKWKKMQPLIFAKPIMEEPDYALKLQIIRDLGKWHENALEVMPPESQVVDVEDVYHLWEFKYLNSFMVDVNPMFRWSNGIFDNTYGEVRYHIEAIHGVRYVFFANRDHVSWKQKQKLKNRVSTEESTAVEIICEGMANANYGCLIILPSFSGLDFGLERPTY